MIGGSTELEAELMAVVDIDGHAAAVVHGVAHGSSGADSESIPETSFEQ